MKKFISLVCGSILILSIAACDPAVSSQNGTSATQVDATTANNNGSYLSISFTDASPVQIQLEVGTLKLESSGEGIDAQTAAELLPLWQAVNSRGSSDTTSAVEMQAIYKQIEETMSTGQIKAITNMQITSQIAAQYALEAGLASQLDAPDGGLNAAQVSNMAASNQAGGALTAGDPGMGGPPDGLGPGVGGDRMQASTNGQAGGLQATGIEGILVGAVIQLLQAKTA